MGRKLFVVTRREFLERVRNRWFVIGTVFGPIFLAALLVVPAWLGAKSRASSAVGNIVIIDATGTGAGDRLAVALGGLQQGAGGPRVREVSATELAAAESLATSDVMENRARGYLVLDEQVLGGGQQIRYAGRNTGSISDMEHLSSSLRQVLLSQWLEREGISPDAARQLAQMRVRLQTARLTERGRGASGTVNILFAIAVGMILYTMLILYGQAVLRSVMEEKQSRVAEVIVSSVKPDALLAGKVIGVGGVGLTQLAIWAAAGTLIVKVREPLLAAMGVMVPPMTLPDISIAAALLLFLFFVLGFIFYASLFAAVGAMVNTEQEAQQAAMPVMLLMIASIVFMQSIIMAPSERLAQVVTLVPFSAPILMPLRLALVQVPTVEIVASLALLLLGCVGAVWLAARIYRTGLLMYGKRPTLMELGRWIREAG